MKPRITEAGTFLITLVGGSGFLLTGWHLCVWVDASLTSIGL